MTEEDEIIRRLKKTSFTEVYHAMEVYAVTKATLTSDPAAVRKILEDHSWTVEEFTDGLLLRVHNINEQMKI
jgi:hypothetical protein